MKVIILAAGIGSRLRPITEKKPKCLVKVCGKTILEWQIEAYLEIGIKQEDIYILIGYKAEQVKISITKRYDKLNYIENKVYDTTNNMYSLKLGLEKVELKEKESLIISNGDCIYENSIVSDLVISRIEDLIPCEKGIYYEENMKILLEDKYVHHISKKITEEQFYGTSVDLYKLSYNSVQKLINIIDDIIQKDKNSWTEVALAILFKNIQAVPMIINGKKWMEIDNIDDLVRAESLFSKFSIWRKKAIILDLDGTVYIGDTPILSAVKFINENNSNFDFYYMTNNTSKSRRKYIEKLKSIGIINISLNQIISPVIPMINHLRSNRIDDVYCVGTESLKNELRSNGIICLNDSNFMKAQAVILGYDTEINYKKIKNTSYLLHKNNIEYYATHSDMVCPTEYGHIPDIGCFIDMFKNTTNRKPSLVFGKPNSVLIEPLLEKYKKHELVLIGDRLYTDKILADNSEIDFICVLSGETNREDIEKIEKWPSLIIKKLGNFKKI